MGDGDHESARPRRPTIRQLAEHTGLSPAAVSYALRGLQVSSETQARVQAAAEELGFRTDPIARALRGGATASVGMVVGSLADLYLQELVAGVQSHLRAGGRQLLIADADGDPALEVELGLELYDRRVDALIVSPIAPFAEGWIEIAQRVPTVSIGERMPGAALAGQVLFDHERAVRAVLGASRRARAPPHWRALVGDRADARAQRRAGGGRMVRAPRTRDASARLRVQPQRSPAARARPARAAPTGRPRSSRSRIRWPSASTRPAAARPAHPRRRRRRRLRRPAVSRLLDPPLTASAASDRIAESPSGWRSEQRGGGAGAHGIVPPALHARGSTGSVGGNERRHAAHPLRRARRADRES